MESGHDDRGSKTGTGTALSPMKNKAYFISDIHLISGASDTEALVVRFLDSIAHDASHLFMVGDILDYWFEYKTVIPRGFTRFFGALARLADSGTKIFWIKGNHDIWLFDYLSNEIGLTVVDCSMTVTLGRSTFFITHGDGYGKRPAAFRLIRSIFRNRLCQRLYAAIHPRWTVGFALAWSRHSRASHHMEGQLSTRQLEDITEWTSEMARRNPDIDYIVLGHHHVAEDIRLSPGCRLIILGDWLTHFTYAVYDGESMSLQQFESKK